MPRDKSWVEISHRALEVNLAALDRAAASNLSTNTSRTAILAVIKANAYGHGATVCAPILARAKWLGVTDAAEGAAVRESLHAAGIAEPDQPQILLMCGLDCADVPLLAHHRLTPVIWFPQQLDWLAAHATTKHPIAVHIEIDTGMARQGARPGEELTRLLAALCRHPQLTLDGVMTHFASAEIAGSEHTHTQQQRFEGALDQLRSMGQHPTWLHAGNTSTLDEARLLPWLSTLAATLGARLLARSGLALYGYTLPLEGAPAQLASALQLVGTWKSRVIAIRDLAPGETIGYNATFTATQPMRFALLPVGYADGLRRELSSTTTQPGGWVMLHGQQAPILGRISMNLTTVDITAIPEAALGDVATLLGPGITAEDHARLAGTIPYEILCGLRARPVLVP
jgi:alanine racemase